MNLFEKQSLEYQIIERLQQQPHIIVTLITDLQTARPTLSKQAVYQVIRKLKKAEIVITHAKKVFLSSVWIDRMHDFFTVAKYTYQGISKDFQAEQFLTLDDGDKIVYDFKNPHTTDIFWSHAVNILLNTLKPHEPIYLYNPHEWFILARQESELTLLKKSQEQNHPWRMYIPSKTKLDEYTKTFFTTPHTCHLNPDDSFKPNQYINIFGDFVIEVFLDQETQKEIDAFFETTTEWNEKAKQELQTITSDMKGKNKFTISRNAKKAEKYKIFFRKYFY